MEERVQQAQQERSAIDQLGIHGVGQAGNKLGMQDTVNESGNGEDETDERAGSVDSKQGAVRADWRANQNEGAERAGQVGEGNEKRIGRTNMMIAAGKEMSALVGEENREKSGGKGEAGSEAKRVFVKERERAEEFVERERPILRIARRDLRPGHEPVTTPAKKEDTPNTQ